MEVILEVNNWIDECDVCMDDWHFYGNHPYLDDDTTNYVTLDCPCEGMPICENCSFYYENLPSNYIYNNINDVYLHIKCKRYAAFWMPSAHLWDGSSWHSLGTFNPLTTWTIWSINVTSILNTVDKINAAKLKIGLGYASAWHNPALYWAHSWLTIDVDAELIEEGDIVIDSKPYRCIEWREQQICKVAVRSVPLRTTGSFVDTDTWTLRNRRLYITVRLTDAQKITLQATFDGHVEVTITAGDWTYTGWFVTKPLVYEYSKNGDGDEREWIVEMEFALSSFSYSP